MKPWPETEIFIFHPHNQNIGQKRVITEASVIVCLEVVLHVYRSFIFGSVIPTVDNGQQKNNGEYEFYSASCY